METKTMRKTYEFGDTDLKVVLFKIDGEFKPIEYAVSYDDIICHEFTITQNEAGEYYVVVGSFVRSYGWLHSSRIAIAMDKITGELDTSNILSHGIARKGCSGYEAEVFKKMLGDTFKVALGIFEKKVADDKIVKFPMYKGE